MTAAPWFRPIGVGGFGDGGNAYAHTMAWFAGRLFVGATRHNLALLHMHDPPPLEPWPVPVPRDVYDLDLRGRILAFDPASGDARWALVAPMVDGRDNRPVPRDIGYRGMTVVPAQDGRPGALYVTTWSPARSQRPPLLLRTYDGEHFEPVGTVGADAGISTFRALVAAGDRLFCAPTGRRQGRANVASGATVLESRELGTRPWRAVAPPGFGEPTNATVFELAVFDGHLWAGTLNPVHGLELWRAPLNEDGLRWSRVLVDGAYRGNLNEVAVSLCPFQGALYVGTGIQGGGLDRAHDVGPAAAELLRVHRDGTFDLVMGESRRTPAGLRSPLSGMGPGFDDPFNGYLWRMAEYDGRLYASTYNWSVFAPHLPLDRAPAELGAALGGRDLRTAAARAPGGFALWRSADGVRWEAVTRDGFGNPYNFGARSLVPTPYGLFVGTANPFGPHVAVRRGDRWAYQPNPRGGCEVWLGTG
jgi:hypothetical protein